MDNCNNVDSTNHLDNSHKSYNKAAHQHKNSLHVLGGTSFFNLVFKNYLIHLKEDLTALLSVIEYH